MPVIIGDFISRNVYDHKLKTVHDIKSRTACRFLDVKGCQEKNSEFSGRVFHSAQWLKNSSPYPLTSHNNKRKIIAITKLARLYVNEGKQYKIITPYDAQRNLIEQQLK